ncbi:unnamed protein product [Closterium sp. Naga37s-1]|nr:unnamed protein product [Closterium sp. Naga37s-1]
MPSPALSASALPPSPRQPNRQWHPFSPSPLPPPLPPSFLSSSPPLPPPSAPSPPLPHPPFSLASPLPAHPSVSALPSPVMPSLSHSRHALTLSCSPLPHSPMLATPSLSRAHHSLTLPCSPRPHSPVLATPSLSPARHSLTLPCSPRPHFPVLARLPYVRAQEERDEDVGRLGGALSLPSTTPFSLPSSPIITFHSPHSQPFLLPAYPPTPFPYPSPLSPPLSPSYLRVSQSSSVEALSNTRPLPSIIPRSSPAFLPILVPPCYTPLPSFSPTTPLFHASPPSPPTSPIHAGAFSLTYVGWSHIRPCPLAVNPSCVCTPLVPPPTVRHAASPVSPPSLPPTSLATAPAPWHEPRSTVSPFLIILSCCLSRASPMLLPPYPSPPPSLASAPAP